MRAVKPLVAFLAFAGIVIGLGSCNQFTPDVYGLSGKTFVYYSNGGHDKATYVFDSTGKVGRFTKEFFNFCYATADAYAGKDVADKIWRQTGGTKGTFSYDPTSFELDLTTTELYGRTSTAQAVGDGSYDEYAWLSLVAYFTNLGFTTYTAYSISNSSNKVFTVDNLEPNTFKNIGGSIWAYIETETITSSNASTKTVSISKTVETFDINATYIDYSFKVNSTLTSNGVEVEANRYVSSNTQNFKVSNWFLVGETPDFVEWGQGWMDGKKVSFQVNRTKFVDIAYTGLTAPVEPPSSAYQDGIADSNPANWTALSKIPPYYHVDLNQYGATYTFEHHGGYILYKLDSAARNL